MKKNRQTIFLEELMRTSNMSFACEKSGLSRQTIYRWMDEDYKFKKKVNESRRLGIDSICDLSETKLFGHIKTGNLKAIQYYLDNHSKEYIKPRPQDFWEKLAGGDNTQKIQIKVYTKRSDVEKDREDEKNNRESTDGWGEQGLSKN